MAYDLYVVTDEGLGNGLSHTEIARLSILGGADAVQLRDKNMPCREMVRVASEIADIAKENGALFFVNDRLDVALASGANGVHLGQDDLPLEYARAIVPGDFLIGVSVGNVKEAVLAEDGGADYIALSPTFNTGSKDDAGPGHGLLELSKISSRVSIPILGIGGIGVHNAADVISAGANGVAVISAVVSQQDIPSAAYEMKEAIRSAKDSRAGF
ncbi:thiamine phosphate synthase [Methanoplanus sp. FWC-SCC4]|uniref:Thiamine-phosphate synthase n=1 Tax=Methanochimaera problematica TaxID=2609417 RepID=A0AA97I390_9EURY|nr:thiamine phosphate synthase [Methanoplanus sp. FWC-SCC4]WOF17100.1 thiamine phosphate synthase [Methanoplanus sp. FWC-SCC4]